jgi:hypothetical protein
MSKLCDRGSWVLLLALFALPLTGTAIGQEFNRAACIGGTCPIPPQEGCVKYVLKGNRGTFHLICGNGTAHYWIRCGHPGSCGCLVPYLAKLKYSHESNGYLFYDVIQGDPHTTKFAIRQESSFCRHYVIYRFVGEHPECMGYFRLHIPN